LATMAAVSPRKQAMTAWGTVPMPVLPPPVVALGIGRDEGICRFASFKSTSLRGYCSGCP